MTSTGKRNAPIWAALVAAVLAVSACSTDSRESPAIEAAKAGRDLIRSLKAASPENRPTAAQVATIGLNSKIQGPLILGITQRSNEATLLALSATNGAYRTFATPTRQAVTLKRGVVSGTRGLNYDLMSVQMDPSVALITSRRAGQAQRLHRYLNVESTETVLTLQCQVSRAGAESLPRVQGGSIATTKMIETCTTSDGESIANQYWVLPDGYIWQSVQWVGPEYGALVLQTLRR